MLMMDDKEFKVAFEAAVTRMVTGPIMVQTIAKSPVTEEALMKPLERLVARLKRRSARLPSSSLILLLRHCLLPPRDCHDPTRIAVLGSQEHILGEENERSC